MRASVPGTLLLLTLTLAFASGEPRAVAGGASLVIDRTFFVAAEGSTSENCDALRDILASLESSLGDALIRLGPGVYDCGTVPVIVGDNIAIEGSGVEQTLLVGSVDNSLLGLLHLNGPGTAVRSLRVRNDKLSPTQAAIGISIWDSGSGSAFAVELRDIEVSGSPEPKRWAVYSIDSSYDAWTSVFEMSIYNAGGTSAAEARLRYSQISGVDGPGTFLCSFCNLEPGGAALSSSCMVVP